MTEKKVTEITEIETIEDTPKWEFRDLKATDIFPFASLLSKIGIGEFASVFTSPAVAELAKEGVNAAAVGASMILPVAQTVLKNLDSCEEDIYRVLAATSNLSIAQIKDLSFNDFFEMVVDFIKKPEFTAFLAQVTRLTK